VTWLQTATLALLLAIGFGAGWTTQGWRGDRALAKLQAEHAWQQGRAAQDALNDTRRIQDAQQTEISRWRGAVQARDRAVRDLAVRLRDIRPADLLPVDPAAECPDQLAATRRDYRAAVARALAVAADAERINEALRSCEAQYESARSAR
jgi:hypothetical protein